METREKFFKVKKLPMSGGSPLTRVITGYYSTKKVENLPVPLPDTCYGSASGVPSRQFLVCLFLTRETTETAAFSLRGNIDIMYYTYLDHKISAAPTQGDTISDGTSHIENVVT